jgi:colanic acid biosynthesis glycosyl transferase WcaI
MKGVVQLWSYNYAPEPTGIAPVSATLARELQGRGWHVEVVAAHPHYPEPAWGKRLLPSREARDGIEALRLPLWIGRGTASERLRQELSYAAALGAAIPLLGRPIMAAADVMIVTSPSFPALLPAMVNARFRRLRWVLWLHDLLPDGASATGQISEGGAIMRSSRRLERAAYRAADSIVALSQPFAANLVRKGVPRSKIKLIYNPATRGFPEWFDRRSASGVPRVLCMGNIGHSQGLGPLVAAFERSSVDAQLVITGTGVAASEVAAEVRSDRIQLKGVVSDDELEHELRSAWLGLISQRHRGTEFNLPSKLMNYMAYGLPVIAAVNPGGEVARLVREADAGWVVDSSRLDEFPQTVARAIADPVELARRGASARAYAIERFSASAFAGGFDEILSDLTATLGSR